MCDQQETQQHSSYVCDVLFWMLTTLINNDVQEHDGAVQLTLQLAAAPAADGARRVSPRITQQPRTPDQRGDEPPSQSVEFRALIRCAINLPLVGSADDPPNASVSLSFGEATLDHASAGLGSETPVVTDDRNPRWDSPMAIKVSSCRPFRLWALNLPNMAMPGFASRRPFLAHSCGSSRSCGRTAATASCNASHTCTLAFSVRSRAVYGRDLYRCCVLLAATTYGSSGHTGTRLCS